jgi:hypothetical protein
MKIKQRTLGGGVFAAANLLLASRFFLPTIIHNFSAATICK